MIVKGKRKAESLLGKKLSDPKYTGKKFFVLSETGKRLFGGYKTEGEAKKRLGQVEFFKRRGNPGKSIAWGKCYRWAFMDVQDNGGTLVHGVVQEPLSSPPRYYDHAWVERNGRVYDEKTMEAPHGGKFSGIGYPIDVYKELFKPHSTTRYTSRKAWKVLQDEGGHYGPWENPKKRAKKKATKRRGNPGEDDNFRELPLSAAKGDPVFRKALREYPAEFLPALELHKRAGFDVEVFVANWGEGDVYLTRKVTAPKSLGKKLSALVWDDSDEGGEISALLTRSTRHKDWQLTRVDKYGPSGHSEVHDFDDIYEGLGQAQNLRQVVFSDGEVMVREGAKEIRYNPAAPKRGSGGGRTGRHKDRLPGGLADKLKPSNFDRKALAKGVKVELEHTGDRALAREITMDHLAEYPGYYDALEKMERELKAGGRVLNPKPFLDRKHDWSQVLIQKGDKRRTRGQVLKYYEKNARKIWPFLKGQTVMVILATGRNKFVLRRKGPDHSYIKLTKLKGIDDPHSFEYWINRRVIEFHPVITGKTTDLIWIDVDPYRKARGASVAKMQRQIRKAVPLMRRLLKDEFGVNKAYVWRSGKKDGGWHVEGMLPRKLNVDKVRKKLRAALDEYFGGDPVFTTAIAKSGQIRLDTTLTKTMGSLRAPYSYTVDGSQKLPVSVPEIAPKLKRKRKAKRNPELTEAEYERAKVEAGARRRPDVDHMAQGGNRLAYEIKLPGREPFIFKVDQGSKGKSLQTKTEVENILKGKSYLFPEMYDYDKAGYRWVEMEKLAPFEDNDSSESKFESLSGVSWEDFDFGVNGVPVKPNATHVRMARAGIVKNKRSEKFFDEIARLWGIGLSPWEMTVLENWGTTLDGESLKYLDLGA